MQVQNQSPIPVETRILVVEDEGIVALDIAAKLNNLGYTPVGTAASGEEALAKVADLNPDLVLMDIRIQGSMDGIETAARIRDRFGIPVVYVTAFGDDETVARAEATNPFGYLLKPFQEKDLRTTVYIALYRHRMESRLRAAYARLELKERRQAAIAELGIRALAGADLSALLEDAAAMVATELEVDHSAILELLPDEQHLLLKAGVGWPHGIVGSTTIEAGRRSLAGYTLQEEAPIVVRSMAEERRFQPWQVAMQAGIVSALSVPLDDSQQRRGVIIASATEQHTFARDDISYVQAIGRVLGAAIGRKQAEAQLAGQAVPTAPSSGSPPAG